jgi:broad specificity phosphatase PhoE
MTTQTLQKPKRKLRHRLIPVLGYMILVLGLAYFFELQATTTVLFVRHADVNPAMPQGDAEPLTARGQLRAELLADFLDDVDVVAGVDAIYVTEALRTQQTAAPLAKRLNREVLTADPYRVGRFMRRVQREHKGKIVLIVTDADAIAPLIDELHGSKRLPTLGPNDFDELYVVTIPWFGKTKTLRLHYGALPAEVEISDSATYLGPR